MSVRGRMGSQPTGLQPAQEIDNFHKRGYGGFMVKRLADWLEKMSVAALAVGLFQGRFFGILLGIGCFALSMWITHREARK